ncbi:MAG: DUF3737 family protein [Clostridia bacterium]|nr:DUF3737 family protein [Clostridia bacterium]
MKEIIQQKLEGERALYGQHGLKIVDCVFENGESPIKECSDIEVYCSLFRWKYPLWYGNNIKVQDCTWYDGARAGVWYTQNISVKNAAIEAPKNFRRCKGVTLENVNFFKAEETLWTCEGVTLKNVAAKGNYFAMNCSDMEVDGLILDGDYSFDGTKNVVIRNSRLLTKDAFWNSENVTVYDSFISGEYLGWNSKNLTLVNCVIESLQGMCYIDDLKMINCKLIDTTLAFEYSSVNAEILNKVDSVFNPTSGTIKAEGIGELIIEKDKVDPTKTNIVCKAIDKLSDRPEWLK